MNNKFQKIKDTGRVFYAHKAQVAIESPDRPVSGEYTPTLTTKTSGVAINTVNIANYHINGDFLTMTGAFELTHPATVIFDLILSLPEGYPATDQPGLLANSPPPSGSCIVTGVNTAFAIGSDSKSIDIGIDASVFTVGASNMTYSYLITYRV